jgi:hexosaminidase
VHPKQQRPPALKSRFESVVPRPRTVQPGTGSFSLAKPLSIRCDPEFVDVASLLSEQLGTMSGVRVADGAARQIALARPARDGDLGPEGYVLEVSPGQMRISAEASAGAFYGVQTLLQLTAMAVAPAAIPCGHVRDKPRHPWRGFMLAMCSTRRPIDEVLEMIDLLSAYKINTLHMHLADNVGWQIEIKGLPRLTEVGAFVGRQLQALDEEESATGEEPGGFYTREEMKDIIACASRRNVTIVPEIDFPGHCLAAVASYPELTCFPEYSGWEPYRRKAPDGKMKTVNPLDGTPFVNPVCAGSERTYELLEKIFKEIAEIFPGPYIHIGGDESPLGAWRLCPVCQAKIRQEGLKGERGLYGYFVRRLARIVESLGKKVIGWGEIYEYEPELPEDVSVLAWREDRFAIDAARDGHDVVLALQNYLYLNANRSQDEYGEQHYCVSNPLRFMLGYSRRLQKVAAECGDNFLGVQGCSWTWSGSKRDDSLDAIFPRALVLSQWAWSLHELELERFWSVLSDQYRVLDARGVPYHVEHPWGLHRDDACLGDRYRVDLQVPIASAQIRYTLDGSEPSETAELFTEPFDVPVGAVIKAKTFLPNGRNSITTVGASRRVKLRPALEPDHPPEPGLNVSVRPAMIDGAIEVEPLNGAEAARELGAAWRVALSVPTEMTEIRYTLDGSHPTAESPRYTHPLSVPRDAVVKATIVAPNRREGRKIRFLSELPPREVVRPGLTVSLEPGGITGLADIDAVGERAAGVVDEISYPDNGDMDIVALRFTGYLRIPQDGVYTLLLRSSDGANVYIDGELCLPNDFIHPPLSLSKRFALARGFHMIRIDHFHSSIFEKFLKLEIEGPRLARQPIPPDMLFHQEGTT